jgi:polyisoprenoid-binding protein YceI
MARWTIQDVHTAAEFSVRHMMITYVRGHFKNISGTLDFEPDHPERASAHVTFDAASLWTGQSERDDHLRSEDFLHVERFPTISFRSTKVEPTARHEYYVTGELTIRGVTRPVVLDVRYLGQGRSPFDDTRAGFTASTRINRHDFEASWNSEMQDGGVVVGDDVFIAIDVEAILDEEPAPAG